MNIKSKLGLCLMLVYGTAIAGVDLAGMCYVASETYAEHAYNLGQKFENVYNTTPPSSLARKNALARVDAYNQQFVDQDAEVQRAIRASEMRSGKYSSNDMAAAQNVMLIGLKVAEISAGHSPGRSKAFYAQDIEQRCRSALR